MTDQPDVRHIACSYDGGVIAVGEFERNIQTWNAESRQRIADFETTLDYGGRRLAINRDGTLCAVGAYHRHGIAVYDATPGDELWRRRDLKGIQSLTFSHDGVWLRCCFGDKPCHVIDIETGETNCTVRGARRIAESEFDRASLLFSDGLAYFCVVDPSYKPIARIEKTSFAPLGVAFSPGRVCISESGSVIRCCRISDGKEEWTYKPKKGNHALRLTYNESAGVFAAIMWAYECGGPYSLVLLDQEVGSIREVAVIEHSWEFGFFRKGSALVCSSGSVLETVSGKLLGRMDFFLREGAD